MENKHLITIIWILVALIVVIIIANRFTISDKNKDLQEAIATSHHFANSLGICIEEKNEATQEAEMLRDFFWNTKCDNRTFKGKIELGYNVMNWLQEGYECDLQRIYSNIPPDARVDDRWISLIDCYKCNPE